MAPKSARLSDIGSAHGCYPATPTVTGSPDVTVNGLPATRVGDDLVPHGCSDCSPHPRAVAEGSPTVFINGQPAARVGDAVDCGGTLATGSPNVSIGDGPGSVNPVTAAESRAFMQDVLRAENGQAGPYERQRLAAAQAVTYRGRDGAVASWQAYYQGQRQRGAALPAAADLTDPLERAGRAHALAAAGPDHEGDAERPPDWIQEGIASGAIDPNRPEAVTDAVFDNGATDDLGRAAFDLSPDEAEALTRAVGRIEDPEARARVIRAIYVEINRADPYAAWFALAPSAANAVIRSLNALPAPDDPRRDVFGWQAADERARIIHQGLAEGNMEVFRSQFRAYAAYRNGGVDAVEAYARDERGERQEVYSDLVEGYRSQERAMAAVEAGANVAARDAYAQSLTRLTAHEQGEAVLQPIYEQQRSVPESGLFGDGEFTTTLGDALNEFDAMGAWMPDDLAWNTVDVLGEPIRFQGSDIGNPDQRMTFAERMADILVQERFDKGADTVAAYNQRSIDHW